MSNDITFDLSKFMPTNKDYPDILERMYDETPINSNDWNDYLALPLNENYILNKITENISNVSINDEPKEEQPEGVTVVSHGD